MSKQKEVSPENPFEQLMESSKLSFSELFLFAFTRYAVLVCVVALNGIVSGDWEECKCTIAYWQMLIYKDR